MLQIVCDFCGHAIRGGMSREQIAADDYYDFEIVNMKSLQDWIVYMLTIPSWHFFSKNIQN